MKKKFTLKKEHIKLLSKAWVEWNDCEAGAPAIDCKRPYGNGGHLYDVAEILGFKKTKDEDGDDSYTDKQLELASKLHAETETALQIILVTKSFKVGDYEMTEDYDSTSWKLKKPKIKPKK